jgi:hypothetical protein
MISERSRVLVIIGMVSLVLITHGQAAASEPPTWSPMPTFQAVEDVPLTIDLSSYIEDADTPLDDIIVDVDSPYVENITGLNVTFLFPNGVTSANISMNVTDGTSWANASVLFTIEPVNDPPTWVDPIGEYRAHSWDAITIELTAWDEDNSLDELTFSDDTDLFEISDTGGIAFTPTDEEAGDHRINLTVTDPGGLSATQVMVLRVRSDPPPPIFHYIEPQSAQVDEVFTLDVSAYWDHDLGNSTFFSDDSPKLEMDPSTGVLTWDAPTWADVGELYVTVFVEDSWGFRVSQQVRITVEGEFPSSVISFIPRQILTQDVRFTYNVTVDEFYQEHPELLGNLTYSNDPTELFVIDSTTGHIDCTPRNRHVGDWEVVIVITDEEGFSESRIVVFTVLNVNDPPVLEYVPIQQLVEGERHSMQLVAHDPDLGPRLLDPRTQVDPNETLTFLGGIEGATIDMDFGVFNLIPDQAHARESPLNITFMVWDNGGLWTSQAVIMYVKDLPESVYFRMMPHLDGIDVYEGRTYTLWAQRNDPRWAVEDFSFQWYEGNAAIGLGEKIEWQPRHQGPRRIRLVVTASDGAESEVWANVTVKSASEPESWVTHLSPLWLFALEVAVIVTAAAVLVYRFRMGGKEDGDGEQT